MLSQHIYTVGLQPKFMSGLYGHEGHKGHKDQKRPKMSEQHFHMQGRKIKKNSKGGKKNHFSFPREEKSIFLP